MTQKTVIIGSSYQGCLPNSFKEGQTMYQHFFPYLYKQGIPAYNNLSFLVMELIPGMSLTLNKPLRHRMGTTDAFKRATQHQVTVLIRGSTVS